MFFFELFLVTLAAYGNAKLIVPFSSRHECEGKTLCDIKPSNYPQEEIDRLVAQNLHHLLRRRRSYEGAVTADDASSGTDACASITQMKTPFTLMQKDVLHVVQNEFFSQQISETFCKNEGSPCLQILADSGVPRSICSTKTSTHYVTVRTQENKLIEVPFEAKTACECKFALD